MKRSIKLVLITVLTAIIAVMFAGCGNNNAEVAGTYELYSISGTVNGIQIGNNSYKYFTIILEENGKGTVQSEGAGIGASKYTATGTYKYKDGKITMTVSNGFATASEEYDYADGMITYVVDNDQMNFTLKLKRVEQEENS